MSKKSTGGCPNKAMTQHHGQKHPAAKTMKGGRGSTKPTKD
jgi:hypothetical protein